MPFSKPRIALSGLVHRSGWIYVSFVLLWLTGRSWFGDDIWWLALLNTIAFYVLVPLGLFVPLAIGLRHWTLLATLTIPTIVFFHWFGGLLMPPPSIPATSQPLTVMTFNLLWGNENYDRISQVVQAANPDILAVQEIRPKNIKPLTAALPGYTNSTFLEIDAFHTIGLLSRFPIQTAAPLKPSPLERGLQADVSVDGRQVKIFVAHLTPTYTPMQPIAGYGSRIQEKYDRREREVDYLAQQVQTSNLPTLLLCDCNLTDTSQAYPTLQAVLSDSFRNAGWGLGHTLAGIFPVPAQRVDYVWHSDAFRTVSAAVGLESGSDHRPAIATLDWVAPPEQASFLSTLLRIGG